MISALQNLPAVDMVFFAALAVALVAGTIRGASGEIARLFSLVCGAAAIWFIYGFLPDKITEHKALVFCGTLALTVLVVVLTHRIAKRVIRLILGQPADAVTGAIMAVIGAFLILSVLWCGIIIFIPQKIYEKHFADTHAEKLVQPLVEIINERQSVQ